MSKGYHIIHDEIPPIMFPECKKLLQLSLKKKVGYWYILKDHIEIRVYGSELHPFLLPIFLTPRVFSLEYIR
jgi:hypothetical protein